MNCRDTESLILAERDGVLTKVQFATLSAHVAACPACHQLRTRLNIALNTYHADAAAVAVPDANAAWHELQARLHEPASKRPLASVIWISAPLAAAAAIAIIFLTDQAPPAPILPPASSLEARADFVEAGDPNASTMVYVDKESGWLVVWATETNTTNKG